MTGKFSRLALLLSTSLGATIVMVTPSAALADCVADSTGVTVTCTGSSATAFSTTTPGVKVNVASGATQTGAITASGAGSTVDSTGTINLGVGVTAITVGGGSTVIEESAATGAITGNIIFGAATGTQVNTLTNASTTYGILGNITSVGTTLINNSGAVSGNLVQTAGTVPGTVTVNNVTGGIFAGGITTQDRTTVTNAGTISGSIVTIAPLTITNSGSLTGSIILNASTTGANSLAITNTGTITGNITEAAGTAAGSITINNQSGATMTGNITTADSVNFTNAGSYSGAVTSTAATTINNTGAMALRGALTGSVTNSGAFSTGLAPSATAPALVTITGNFVQTNTGTLNVVVLSPTDAGIGYGQIRVTGTATLAGTVAMAPAAGFYPTGSKFNVVIADQGIINNGYTITGTGVVSPFLSFTSNGIVSTGSTTVPGQQALQLTATRAANYAAVLAPTATANQLSVARGFQPLVATASATPTGDAATLVGAVDYMSIARAQAFFDQASPEAYRAYVTALQDQGSLFNRQVSLRLDTIAITKDLIGLWIQPYFQRGRNSATYGSKQDIFGLGVGYDVGTEAAHAGIALGYSQAKVAYNPGFQAGTSDAIQVAAYGQLTRGGLKADLQLGYLNGKISSTRIINLVSTTRTATGSANANIFRAVGTLGYDFGNDDNRIQPFVGVDASKGNISSFTETGANAANLTVGKLSADRTDVIVGLDYARKTGSILPYFRVAYRRDLQTPNGQVTAYFNGDTTTSFTVTGIVPARSQEEVNVGLRKKIHDDNSQIFVGYQGTFREGMTSHGANIGLFVTF